MLKSIALLVAIFSWSGPTWAKSNVGQIDHDIFQQQIEQLILHCQNTKLWVQESAETWENPRELQVHCLRSGVKQALQTENRIALSANGHVYCANPGSDPDGDGYGWENQATCVVARSVADRYRIKYPRKRFRRLRRATKNCKVLPKVKNEVRCIEAHLEKI